MASTSSTKKPASSLQNPNLSRVDLQWFNSMYKEPKEPKDYFNILSKKRHVKETLQNTINRILNYLKSVRNKKDLVTDFTKK